MEPNTTNNSVEPPIESPQVPPEMPTPVFQQPEQPQTTPKKPKKSNKKLYIIIGVVVVIIAAATIVYFVFGKQIKEAVSNSKNNVTSTTKTQTDTSRVGLTTSVLTTNATDESKTANTNNSSLADEASNDVNSVGDSVNENNLK